jgi:hypothetical protein
MINKIIDYENGEMTEGEVIKFFQELVNSGMIYHLQGSYQRTANDLLESGLIMTRENYENSNS